MDYDYGIFVDLVKALKFAWEVIFGLLIIFVIIKLLDSTRSRSD